MNDGGPLIAFLQFADDSLFLLEPDPESLSFLRGILLIFEMASGLKVNLRKSKIIQVGDVPNIEDFAFIMGCGVESLPSSYLGLPLGAKSSGKSL